MDHADGPGDVDPTDSVNRFEDLPPDVAGAILCSPCLAVRDLLSLACTCRVLRDAVADDIRCWMQLVERGWGRKTSPRHWIAASHRVAPYAMAPCPSTADGMNLPTPDYRSLHRVLTVGDSLSGWWKSLDGPKGSLFRLEWGKDCLRALQLHGHTQSKDFSVSPLFKLGPGHALTVAHSLDDTHLVVRCYAPPKAAPAAAEAAAAAATLAASPSTSFPFPSAARTPRKRGGSVEGATAAVDAAGASPPAVAGSTGKGNNFAAEVLRFMSGQVQAPRKATRRSQKRASSLSASSSQAAVPTTTWGAAGSTGDASEGEEGGVSVGLISGAGAGNPGFPTIHSPSSSAPHASIMMGPLPHQVAAAGRGSSSSSYMPSSSWAAHAHAHTNGTSPVGTASGSTIISSTTNFSGLGSSGQASTSAGGNRSSALTRELQSMHMGPSVHASPPMLSGPAISTHHFVRLRPAIPSKQHPLLGLWKGIHGQHGLQVLEVYTDFFGPSAKILGQKATGDVNVPAGKVCWWAFASPMPAEEATSEQEVRLQQARQWLLSTPDEEEVSLPEVISCHKGKGQIAVPGFNAPQWVNGRLWRYEGKGARQSFDFMWMAPGNDDQPLACVTYSRLPESPS